jgi:hypothetical protein
MAGLVSAGIPWRHYSKSQPSVSKIPIEESSQERPPMQSYMIKFGQGDEGRKTLMFWRASLVRRSLRKAEAGARSEDQHFPRLGQDGEPYDRKFRISVATENPRAILIALFNQSGAVYRPSNLLITMNLMRTCCPEPLPRRHPLKST